MKKYTPLLNCSICLLPQSNHTNPIVFRLCQIQLATINLRLEERELRQQLKNTESVSKSIETVENSQV